MKEITRNELSNKRKGTSEDAQLLHESLRVRNVESKRQIKQANITKNERDLQEQQQQTKPQPSNEVEIKAPTFDLLTFSQEDEKGNVELQNITKTN